MSESTKIVARNRQEFLTKIKEALKRDYPQGSEIDVARLSERYGVRKANIRLAVEELEAENYKLILPTVTPKTAEGVSR